MLKQEVNLVCSVSVHTRGRKAYLTATHPSTGIWVLFCETPQTDQQVTPLRTVAWP